MSSAVQTYLQQESSAHRIDVRSKILMLAVYSVSIFFVDTWWGMAVFALLFIVAAAVSNVDVRKLFKIALPVYVIAVLTVVFNMFVATEAGVIFSLDGLVRGAFFASRILLLVWTSLVLCLSATPDDLTRAFSSLMSPLRKLHVPVDDIATVFSTALRFIPLTVAEFFAVRSAQWARGAKFDEGSVIARIKAHCVIFIPMFIAMFRRADRLALAMDARCYGLPDVRPTQLRDSAIGGASILVLLFSVSVEVFVAIVL